MKTRHLRKIYKKTRKLSSFLGLIVRCKNEIYVREFVDYYLQQGVDTIYIVDDHSDKKIYKDVNHPNVKIIFEKNHVTDKHKMDSSNKLYKKIKHLYEWIIFVDMDEFITTKKDVTKTIRDELKTTFKDCMCVKIPWVMMSCNSIKHNPSSLLKTNVYRWNHDKKHVNTITDEPKFRCRYNEIEVKCIFKPKYFKKLSEHYPLQPIGHVKVIDSIYKKDQELNPFYKNLREKNIQEGYLLCYHYRIISVENCVNKIKHNAFYKKYKLKDLLSFDYPEVIDKTLHDKM